MEYRTVLLSRVTDHRHTTTDAVTFGRSQQKRSIASRLRVDARATDSFGEEGAMSARHEFVEIPSLAQRGRFRAGVLAIFFGLTLNFGPVTSSHAEATQSPEIHNSWLLVTPTHAIPADNEAAFTATVVVATKELRPHAVMGETATFQAVPAVAFSAGQCITDHGGMCSVTFTSAVAGRVRLRAIIGDANFRLSLTPVIFADVDS